MSACNIPMWPKGLFCEIHLDPVINQRLADLFKKSLIFASLVCLIAIERSPAWKPPPSVKDFHGLKLNFFHEETGRRFSGELPRRGLRKQNSIPHDESRFPQDKDLKIEMDAKNIDS